MGNVVQVGAAGGGAGTPGGSNTQVQYNNAGAFGGAANVTYSGGVLSVAAAGALAMGSGPAAGGAIRLSNAQGIGSNQNPSSGNTITLVITDSSNNVYFGDASYGATTYLRSPSQVDLRIGGTSKVAVTSSAVTFSTHAVMGSNSIQFGTNTASAGNVRNANGASMLVVRNSTNNGNHIVALSNSDNMLFCSNDAVGTSTVTSTYVCASSAVYLVANGTSSFIVGLNLPCVPNGANLSVGSTSPSLNSATNTICITNGTAASGAPTNGAYLSSNSGRLQVRSSAAGAGAAVNMILDSVVGGFSTIDPDHGIKIIIDKPGSAAQTRWIRFYT